MTAKDKRFAEEYMLDLNAYQAAMRAGFAETTARVAAAWIKPDKPKKPGLRAYLDMLMLERRERTNISADRVVEELAKVAFASIGNIVDFHTGAVLEEAPEQDKAAIASIRKKKGEGNEMEVKMYDKARALELLGKHLGMFTDKVQVNTIAPVIVDDIGRQ